MSATHEIDTPVPTVEIPKARWFLDRIEAGNIVHERIHRMCVGCGREMTPQEHAKWDAAQADMDDALEGLKALVLSRLGVPLSALPVSA